MSLAVPVKVQVLANTRHVSSLSTPLWCGARGTKPAVWLRVTVCSIVCFTVCSTVCVCIQTPAEEAQSATAHYNGIIVENYNITVHGNHGLREGGSYLGKVDLSGGLGILSSPHFL